MNSLLLCIIVNNFPYSFFFAYLTLNLRVESGGYSANNVYDSNNEKNQLNEWNNLLICSHSPTLHTYNNIVKRCYMDRVENLIEPTEKAQQSKVKAQDE